mmetsp:Transcript_15799/g.23130  ORF Transcript_15799/g.23130 Transcript_15799/m.23130 type:complete len:448 (-) Transcript_15799:217-1560(-)
MLHKVSFCVIISPFLWLCVHPFRLKYVKSFVPFALQSSPSESSAVPESAPHKFATRAVHAGCEPELNSWAVVPPISLATTFTQSYPGDKPGVDDLNSYGGGFFYSRQANPTRGAIERAIANVEGGKHCSVFASGLAATQAVIQLLSSGDHVIVMDGIYGGTTGMFRNILTNLCNITFTSMPVDDISAIQAAYEASGERTKLIWLESPTNPLLKTADIRAVAQFAKSNGILVAVDSTFMSPFLQHPLQLGADIVVHSVTKYIAGHSDVLMGAAITDSDAISKKLRALQNFCGAVPSPFECYLALRGLKTLHLRMAASQKNAMAVASFLEGHPAVEKVVYPGLKSYEQYELAKSQTDGPGAMLSVYFKGGLPAAGAFLSKLKVFALAVSLGAVESLACSPAIMTHTALSQADRDKIGLSDGLVRLSLGIEDEGDLLADLQQALSDLNLP